MSPRYLLRALALCLVLAASGAAALADTIDFSNLTTVNDSTFKSQGLLLSLVNSLAYDVGCGGAPHSCLGADATTINDFKGTIQGSFVLPGTSNAATVTGLDIVLAGNNPTTASLFDVGGALIGSFTGSFSYAGATPVAFFTISFEQNAMHSLSFTGAAPAPVSEPSSTLLLGTALSLGLLARKLLAS